MALLILAGIATAVAESPVREQDLVGVWHSTSGNMAAVEVAYTADHQYTLRYVGIVTGKMIGTWRLEQGRLITKWTGGQITSLATKEVTPPDGRERTAKVNALTRRKLVLEEEGKAGETAYERGAGEGMEIADKPIHFPSPAEKYDAAVAALAAATTPEARLNLLGRAAKQHLLRGDFKAARAEAEELLALKEKLSAESGSQTRFERNAAYLDAVEDGNMLLGLCAVQAGDLERAGQALLASTKVPACTSTSFGPNMRLAQALLRNGQREIVLRYFERCGEFWQKETLAEWSEQVRRGEMPEFGANLRYHGFEE